MALDEHTSPRAQSETTEQQASAEAQLVFPITLSTMYDIARVRGCSVKEALILVRDNLTSKAEGALTELTGDGDLQYRDPFGEWKDVSSYTSSHVPEQRGVQAVVGDHIAASLGRLQGEGNGTIEGVSVRPDRVRSGLQLRGEHVYKLAVEEVAWHGQGGLTRHTDLQTGRETVHTRKEQGAQPRHSSVQMFRIRK